LNIILTFKHDDIIFFDKLKNIFEPEYKVTWDWEGTYIIGIAAKNAEILLAKHEIYPITIVNGDIVKED